MCVRKLGRIREVVKIMRDLMKEFFFFIMLNIYENFLELFLELQVYVDVQVVLVKYDDISFLKLVVICYIVVLLKIRIVLEKFFLEIVFRRGLSIVEINVVEVIYRVVEFNFYVLKFLE